MSSCNSDYIVKYYGSGVETLEEGGTMASPKKKRLVRIIMEYCQFGSIHEVMKKLDHGLSEPQIICVAHDVLKGLQYLHSNRKIHRDIKCDNILLNERGEAKLGIILSLFLQVTDLFFVFCYHQLIWE